MLDDVEKFLLRKIGCTTLCYERFGIHSINGTFLFKDCISHVLLEARGGMLTLKGLRVRKIVLIALLPLCYYSNFHNVFLFSSLSQVATLTVANCVRMLLFVCVHHDYGGKILTSFYAQRCG